jgi:acetoacetyl-CoA synthetase
MDVDAVPRKLWEHPDPKSTAMWRFMEAANERYGLRLGSFQELYDWSCRERVQFYGQLWEWQSCIYEGSFSRVVDEAAPIDSLPRWFEGVRLNMTENMLWTRGEPSKPWLRGTRHKEDDKVAVTEVREGGREVRHVTWRALRQRAGDLAGALKARGIKKGDRVVMVGGHSSATLVVLLASMWLGALFSSSSTDMGVGGLLQRTAQIEPRFVFFDDGALYNGKVIDLRGKIRGMMEGLVRDCRHFESMVIVQRFDEPYDTSAIPRTERLEAFLQPSQGSPPPPIERIGFQDPTIIYYSSGTTGTPKAIVHGVGPLMLNFWKEYVLHREQGPDDVAMQYTTTGWIMYLASITHLILGGRAVFYDGSPLMPDRRVLLRVAAEQGVSNLGISPRWMGELLKGGVVPRDEFDLSRLRVVVSTGMVLSDQLFEWFYDVGFPRRVHLANISGGTDIVSRCLLQSPSFPPPLPYLQSC